jgi:hypothetical protein
MKKMFLISFLFFGSDAFTQSPDTHIFSDTSVYFINSMQTGLSPDELKQTSQLLEKAIKEYIVYWEHWMDSLSPKTKKKHRVVHIDPTRYYYRLTARINPQGHKIVDISASGKDWFKVKEGKKSVPDKEWKKKFYDGNAVSDGGTSFLFLTVNLTLQTHNELTSNGTG